MGLAADLFRLSRSKARTEIPADPDRHHPARRPRASRTRPQDDGQAAGDGIRGLVLRTRGRRSWLWQGQPGARQLYGSRLYVPVEQDRLAGPHRVTPRKIHLPRWGSIARLARKHQDEIVGRHLGDLGECEAGETGKLLQRLDVAHTPFGIAVAQAG